MADNGVKVFFRLERDKDGYPPEEVEALWAIPRPEGLELDSIPFYARGIALGDVVHANVAADGGLEFDRVVRRGGHSTYQVLLRERRPDDPQFTIDEFRSLGLAVESDLPYLLAVDVPPSVCLEKAEEFLFAGEDSNRWGLREGYRAGD